MLTTNPQVPHRRRAAAGLPCFVVGNVPLPAEVVNDLGGFDAGVTCNFAKTTIDGVPDVQSGNVTFSSINFKDSDLTPLEFALSEFATTEPLADNDLTLFEARESVYLATEDGIRSVGGGLQIKDPRFFLGFQIARIKTAQGQVITNPSDTVDHLLGKVLSNGAEESAATKAKVTALSTILS